MVEFVDGFEAHYERRVAVLLQDDGGGQRRLQAMRGVMPDDAAKASQRGAARRRLGVVGQCVQPALHVIRRLQPRDQPPLGMCEFKPFALSPRLRASRSGVP